MDRKRFTEKVGVESSLMWSLAQVNNLPLMPMRATLYMTAIITATRRHQDTKRKWVSGRRKGMKGRSLGHTQIRYIYTSYIYEIAKKNLRTR